MQIQIREQLASISNQLPTWLWNLIVLGSALLIGVILKFVITALLRHYKNVAGYSVFKSILTHLGKPLDYFVPLFMLDVMLPVMKLNEVYIDPIDRVLGILLIISVRRLTYPLHKSI